MVEIINEGDVCSLGLAALILMMLGRLLADDRQQRWGSVPAVVAFLAYCAYAFDSLQPVNGQVLLGIVVRALAAFTLVLGTSWIVLPLAHGFWMKVVMAALWKSREWGRRYEPAVQHRAWEQEEERRRRERDAAWERSAPERAVALQEAAEKRQRYEEALQECEFLYVQSAPELGGRMPRELFDSLANKYLQPDLPADLLQARARKLQELLRKHLEAAKPAPKFTSLADILKWFEEKKHEIESGPGDDKQKQTYLVQLKIRYAELVKSFIEET